MLAGCWRSERMPALYARGELAGRGVTSLQVVLLRTILISC